MARRRRRRRSDEPRWKKGRKAVAKEAKRVESGWMDGDLSQGGGWRDLTARRDVKSGERQRGGKFRIGRRSLCGAAKGCSVG